MKQKFMRFSVMLIVFLGIDMVWLTLIAQEMYAKALAHLMADQVNFVAAFIFYLLFVLAMQVFVLEPALQHKNLRSLLTHAALFGLVTYATYDLTNLATLKDWPILLTMIDLVWGMFVSISVALITYFIFKNKETTHE